MMVSMLLGCGSEDPAGRLADAPPAVDAAPQLDAAPPVDAAPGGDVGCVPTSPAAETCDRVDNDCDGLIDNVDVGGDGIYDCQRVLLLGGPGALPSSNFEQWAHGNGSIVTRLADSTVTVDAALLASFDLVLIDRVVRLYTADEAAALSGWVHGGGGVMALSGYSGGSADLDNPNSLVAGMGLRFTGNLLNGPVTTFVSHPLTTGLTSVTFAGGFPVAVDPTAEQPVVVGQAGAMTVAVAASYGSGRIYLWGDEWVTFDSEWVGSAEIQQFWVDAFGWLGKLR